MLRRSFLIISVLVICMTAILVNDASGRLCSRCRTLPGICLETLWEKIKVTFKTQTTTGFTLEAKSVAFTDWCNPAGQCHSSFDIADYDPFFNVDFSTSSFTIVDAEAAEKARWFEDKAKEFDCELRDIFLCATGTVTREFTEDGVTYEVQVCESYLDPSKIPPEAYWDDGQVGKWTYRELYCPSPWVYGATSPEEPGEFLVGTLWVSTFKEVTKCTGSTCTTTIEEGESGCFELDTSAFDRLLWDYNPAPDSACGM